jgi:hypothetical protein
MIHWVGSAGCPANLVGTGENGELNGTTTIKAYKDVAGVEGEQVDLEAT